MTIKALKQTISIAEIQKLIHQWRGRGLNDPTITKLLDLYLGMPAYMNARGIYPLCNFYDMRLSLRFAYTSTLITAVTNSRSFGLVWDNTHTKIIAFYSPLWFRKEEKEETPQPPQDSTPKTPQPPQDSAPKTPKSPQDSAPKTPKSPQDSAQDAAFDYNNILYNINNIYPPEDSRRGKSDTGKAQAPDTKTGKTQAPDTRTGKAHNADARTGKAHDADAPPPAAAAGFFHRLNTTPEEKRQVLVPIIDDMAARKGYPRKKALQATVILVNRILVPYFDANPRFAASSHAGKIAWLRNLLKTAHGQSMMEQATRQLDTELEHEREEKRQKRRTFRPLSPAEWQDPDTGTRYYDDPIDGKVEIPADAPPRPADTAIWNVLSHEWIDTAG